MSSHIEDEKLRLAAQKKICLTNNDWHHIETCRSCVARLTDAVKQAATTNRVARVTHGGVTATGSLSR